MREPLYRRTFDAGALLRDHPPQFHHPHKVALFELAYPQGTAPPGAIDVTRWAEHVPASLPLPEALSAEVLANFYDYSPVGPAGAVEWHVNFSDPRVFVAYGSGLFAQDEMQAAEHPLLGSIREALLAEELSTKTRDETSATPILVTGVPRRLEVLTNVDATAGRPAGLYGNRFAEAPWEAILRATRLIEPATTSHIIAMAAPSGGEGDYTEAQIARIFATACTAFSAAVEESARIAGAGSPTVVHTGFWGCGAFGGNRRLMIALQALAARAAGVHHLVLHAGDAAGAAEAERGLEVADSLAFRCGSPATLDTIVGRSVILGYRWGVSDGN